MTTCWTVRLATAEDCTGILACLGEAFEPYRAAYTPDAFIDTVLTMESLADRFAGMTILVAVAPDESGADANGAVIVGTIAASAQGGEGHLRGMAVRGKWQGQGIAVELLRSAESLLREHGCRRVTLDTTAPLTRAIASCRRHNYTPTGRTQDFYGMALYEFAKEISGT